MLEVILSHKYGLPLPVRQVETVAIPFEALTLTTSEEFTSKKHCHMLMPVCYYIRTLIMC